MAPKLRSISYRTAGPVRDRLGAMTGREYFSKLSADLRLDGLDPTDIVDLEQGPLKTGPVESRLGGRIARDLTRLTPDQVVERRLKSEELLQQPRRDFPAESAR
jgi:hypothetical protein